MSSIHTIKKTLQAIGFKLIDGKRNVWSKGYTSLDYAIDITLGNTASECRIDFGDEIKSNAGRRSTQSLSQPESLVVLECVDRLLTLGYGPSSLILEQQYPLGHTHGYLDILVLHDGRAYLMIECKTWGAETEKERARLFSDGGQLLSYFQQNRATKFIALYTSRLSSGVIERSVCAIDTSFLDGDSVAELFESWDKSFFEVGAFEGVPYQIQERRLIKADLADMKQEDGGRIFNDFAEILRRYVISDKPNAFNKIFNLFICKVQDEEKQDDEILDFQWQAGENAKTVLSRLNDLYKAGMSQYLRMEIADHNEAEIERRLAGSATESDKQALRTIFTELRLFKNNEFAFKEVFDEKTFNANAEVVREVVRLLQGKRIRYTSKQQFLGDFFELLLNTSVKQEAGQFFTPIPIARFIIDSLPLRAIINNKIKANDANFLPYFLDYASGSGHFLTEAMDRIDRMVKDIDGAKLRTSLKSNLRKWRADYAWANEFMYGIEKDYRLAKTAKVSCFLNGDGEANLIHGDGLDSFSMSQEYIGRLLNPSLPDGQRDNQQFDVIAANPPYSVPACKKTIRHGEKSFSLWPRLTEYSSEIECLFIERTKQALSPGGVAGLLLPTSILSNGGIHEAARSILLRYFKIKALVVLGSGTFMATGTNTVILFLQRRENDEYVRISSLIEGYYVDWRDVTVAGQEDAFSLYAHSVWNLELAVFSALLRGDEISLDHPLLLSYRKTFHKLSEIRALKEKNKQFKALSEAEKSAQLESRFRVWLRDSEREKMLFFFLTNRQSVVLARAPVDKAAEKKFLGYEFSNRKGTEGLKILSTTGQIETTLYSETNDADPDKINTIIRQSFLDEPLVVSSSLADCVDIVTLSDLMSFDLVHFDKAIGTNVKKKVCDARWAITPLGEVLSLEYGKSLPRAKHIPGAIPVMGSNGIVGHHNAALVKGPAIIVGRKGSVGRVTWVDEDCFPIDTAFWVKLHNNQASLRFIFYALKQLNLAKLNNGLGPGGLNRNDAYDLPLQLPPPSVQARIVNRLTRYDQSIINRRARIKAAAQPLYSQLAKITSRVPLSDLCELSNKRVDPGKKPEISFNYIGLEHIVEGAGSIVWPGPSKGASIKSTKNVFIKGDVLYGKLRPYLNKVWIAEFDGVCTTELLVLKPRGSPLLLKYLLLDPTFVEQASAKTGGISLPRIKPADVMKLLVPSIRTRTPELNALALELETHKDKEQAKLERLLLSKAAYLQKWLP